MIKKHFSFEETFRFGWAKTRQHAWFLVLTFIIAEIILGAVKFTPVVNVVVGLFVGLSLASISLIISRDQSFSFRDLYTPFLSPNLVLKFIALASLYLFPIFFLALLYAMRIFGSTYNMPAFSVIGTSIFTLLILPVIYFSVRLKFFSFILLDNQNLSIKELIAKSYLVTKGHFLAIALFLIALGGLNILGMLFFVVGLVVTIPVSLFATAHVYNKLKEHSF